MGACDFGQIGKGKNVKEAFSRAVEDARYENGHGGYSGSLAEKHDFVLIDDTPAQILARLVEQKEADRYIEAFKKRSDDSNSRHFAISEALLHLQDRRVDDKWGPAGAIKIKDGEWLFFGMAPS